MELLAGRGVTHFYVSDDTFTMDRDRVIQVCRLILDRGLAVTWAAISRVDFIDPQMLGWMRRAGCVQISFGVESGSAAIRRALGKPVPREAIVEAFRDTVSAGILPRAYFIYGSPGETAETVRESIDLMEEIRPLGAIFYLLTVFPGTALCRSLEAGGRIDDETWSRPLEDLPWFQAEGSPDLATVQAWGDSLRHAFHSRVGSWALDLSLPDDPGLRELHADFLSRLGMTFSHGEYAANPFVPDGDGVARELFRRSLGLAPDPRAHLGLALLRRKHGDFAGAADQAALGLESFPGERNLTVCRAVCLMNLGRFSDALGLLEPLGDAPDIAPYLDACRRGAGGASRPGAGGEAKA
jgi:hypothetical protein